MKNWIFISMLIALNFGNLDAQIFKTIKGEAYFKSDAPLELIEAKSKKLKGVINSEKRTFAFSIPIQSFKGFNSALQRIHFNENYLESDAFSNATFTGKIIEKIDFSKDGVYNVRAKGKLKIHNIEQERIIKSKLEIKNGKVLVRNKVLETKGGFLLFGTSEGLFEYDGQEFTPYLLNDSIPDIEITALFEDQKLRVWIGTKTGDIYLLNTKNQLEKWLPEEGTPKVKITGFEETRDSVFWISTYGEGLY